MDTETPNEEAVSDGALLAVVVATAAAVMVVDLYLLLQLGSRK